MHKNKINKYQGGGFLKGLFNNSSLTSLFKNIGSAPGGGTNLMPTGIDQQQGETEAEKMNGVLGGITNGALTGLLNFSTINNSNLNKNQKTMAKADAAVDTISSLSSNIPGLGGIIGGSLSAINKIGGAFVKTPKEIKNYVGNDDVASSSSFTGVASDMGEVSNSIDSWKGSGLAGKLFGGRGLKNNIAKSNTMQSQVGKELDFNKFAKNRATSSSDLFSTRTTMKNYGGDMWTNREIQYGQTGTKLVAKTPDYVSKVDGYKTTNSNLQAYKDKGLNFTNQEELGKWYDSWAKPTTGYDTSKRFSFGPIANRSSVTTDEWSYLQKSLGLNSSHTRGIATDPNNPIAQYNPVLMENMDKVKSLLSKMRAPKVEQTNQLQPALTKLKEGGVMNVIVDGALHARKHNLKELDNFKDAEITHKGVPVVIEMSVGGVIQQAEVEVGELILHKKLTSQMEDLAKEGNDEAMIQAGRILAKEIVKNTKDKTGILKIA